MYISILNYLVAFGPRSKSMQPSDNDATLARAVEAPAPVLQHQYRWLDRGAERVSGRLCCPISPGVHRRPAAKEAFLCRDRDVWCGVCVGGVA